MPRARAARRPAVRALRGDAAARLRLPPRHPDARRRVRRDGERQRERPVRSGGSIIQIYPIIMRLEYPLVSLDDTK
jgi:hypothetical protein